MQIATMVIAGTLLVAPITWAVDERSACELLPPPLVSSVAGSTLHIDPSKSSVPKGRGDTCTYAGDSTKITFSVRPFKSEAEARSEFAGEIARTFGDGRRSSLLRGVGVEARFQPSAQGRGGTILARHSSIIFVITGNADQEVLVALARGVVAQLQDWASA